MKFMNEITFADVKAVMQAKGYEVYTDGRPNIVGIRSAVRDSNEFNDICFCWWDEKVLNLYSITTHPGYYYLQNPIAGTKGAAIVVPGQYKDLWTLGMHRHQQFALIQIGPVKVYRDNNKDKSLDYDPKTIETGLFGINGHHAAQSDINAVGPWSAGCQVWRYHQPHIDLMQEFKRISEAGNFHRFTYTLLVQEDFV